MSEQDEKPQEKELEEGQLNQVAGGIELENVKITSYQIGALPKRLPGDRKMEEEPTGPE